MPTPTSGWVGQILVGLAAAAGAGGVVYVARTPTYLVEGPIVMHPDDAGGFSGSIAAVVSTVTAVPPDSGVLPDAGVRPDSGSIDAAVVDSGPPDSGVVVAVPDAGPINIGLYEPPGPTDAGMGPQGRQLTVNVLAAPAALGSVSDANFPGVTIRRLLAAGHQEYSQLAAYSTDGRYLLLSNTTDNQRGVYDATTLAVVYEDLTSTWSAPRWIPNSHAIAYMAANPVRLMRFDIDTRATTTLVTTTYPNASYSETFEQPSDDGVWWSIYGQPATGNRVIMSANASTGALGAVLPLDTLYTTACTAGSFGREGPDFIAISPLGRFLAVQWRRAGADRCSGLELYDIATGAFVRQLHQDDPHGDWGVDPISGREFYLTSVLASPLNNNWPSFQVQYLDGLTPALKYPREYAWDQAGSAFDHVSCLSRGTSYCVVTAGGEYRGGPLLPGLGEIYLLYLNGSERRLLHHRSSEVDASGAEDYWALPKASVSHDGRKIVFSSNWGTAGAVAPYEVNLSSVPLMARKASKARTVPPPELEWRKPRKEERRGHEKKPRNTRRASRTHAPINLMSP